MHKKQILVTGALLEDYFLLFPLSFTWSLSSLYHHYAPDVVYSTSELMAEV